MRRRRRFCLVLLLAAVALAVGAGGFEEATSDRAVAVSVADDDSALLGLTVQDPSLAHNTSRSQTEHEDVELLSVRNGFPNDIESVDVQVVDDGGDVAGVTNVTRSSGTPLGSGETGDVTADIVCERAGTASVELALTASGQASTVDVRRTVSVTCGS